MKQRFGLLLILMLGVKLYANDYLVYIDEIVNEFVTEVEEEYGLCWIGNGDIPYDMQAIDLQFVIQDKTTIEKSRELGVGAVQKLLHKINGHGNIRPFLEEYPFKANRVSITIAFQTENNQNHTDGSPTYVQAAKNLICYHAVKLVKEKSDSKMSLLGKDVLFFPEKEGNFEQFVPLLVETFDDAVKTIERA